MTSPVLPKPVHNAHTSGLAKSIGRGTIFGIIANSSQVITRLVTVPIVISHLGLDGYGIWSIIMTTATYMRFGSVGVKTAFQKYVAETTGTGDYEKANKLLSTGFALMLAFSVAGLIPVSLFSYKIALASGVPPQFLNSASGAISLLAWIMVLSNAGATFEAIVMGGHRIDLVRKYATILTIAEAISIVVLLHFGYGLFAMAATMGISELIYVVLCAAVSKRIVPQISLSWRRVTHKVLYELFRFAGSYQLLNLLEVLYVSLLPFAVLRSFGATEAGVLALVNRIVTSAAIIQEAFLPPILSGGALVFASGSVEKLKLLLTKAFKVTLAMTLFPLGYIALFGTTLAFAWTGQINTTFRFAFWMVCLTNLFKSFSLLALVLYRTTGKALLDNVRQLLRIVVIIGVVWLSPRLGFDGSLSGLAFAELVGMIFMFFALSKTFSEFRANLLFSDMSRLTLAIILILFGGVALSKVPVPSGLTDRTSATLTLFMAGFGCVLTAWPAIFLTRAINGSELRALFGRFFERTNNPAAAE